MIMKDKNTKVLAVALVALVFLIVLIPWKKFSREMEDSYYEQRSKELSSRLDSLEKQQEQLHDESVMLQDSIYVLNQLIVQGEQSLANLKAKHEKERKDRAAYLRRLTVGEIQGYLTDRYKQDSLR